MIVLIRVPPARILTRFEWDRIIPCEWQRRYIHIPDDVASAVASAASDGALHPYHSLVTT